MMRRGSVAVAAVLAFLFLVVAIVGMAFRFIAMVGSLV